MPTQRASGDCAFCAIATHAQEANIVFEDRDSIGFLDRRPVFHGHTLLIPKAHFETLADLPSEVVGPLFGTAQLLALAVQEAMKADGSFLAVNNRISQSVPHLHVHIVPRKQGDGLRGFFWPRTKYLNDGHAEEVRKAIAEAVRGRGSRTDRESAP
ncbi:MAG: HIT family protein [Chloroflexi bacterium]|nr:HIT family protein [Chloroflexota bacterium]